MFSQQSGAFLVEFSGVVYLGDGALSEAVESVNRLGERDKELRLLTNDPRFQRQTIANKLREDRRGRRRDHHVRLGDCQPPRPTGCNHAP
ncbi:hypothetical protein [Haloarcula sp. H-GB5]